MRRVKVPLRNLSADATCSFVHFPAHLLQLVIHRSRRGARVQLLPAVGRWEHVGLHPSQLVVHLLTTLTSEHVVWKWNQKLKKRKR